MALQEIKSTTENLPKEIEDVIGSQLAYYKLYAFRVMAKNFVGLTMFFVFGLGAFLFLLLLSLGAAFALETILGSALAFGVVSLVWFLVFLVIYIFRKRLIHKPLLKKLSEIYFDKNT